MLTHWLSYPKTRDAIATQNEELFVLWEYLKIYLIIKSFPSADYFQTHDRETQEAQMSIHVSQKIIRFKSMNSSVNLFTEWQKWLDITESDYDLINLIKN